MLISAHETNNMYFLPNTPAAQYGWALGWTSQQLISATEEAKTGGTYE